MKAVILRTCSVDAERNTSHSRRAEILVRAIARGGIAGEHHPAGSARQLIRLLDEKKPDLVFSASYFTRGKPGERRTVHEILERNGIPFIGSPSRVLELVLSKAELKEKWRESGVPTPDFFQVRQNPSGSPSGLAEAGSASNFPYIVKPLREGNSRGISEDSVVHTREELLRQISLQSGKYGDVLVEHFLGCHADVREFTVALIGNGAHAVVLPSEIRLSVPRRVRVITTEDKELHRTEAVPVRDPLLRMRLIDLAESAFAVAGVRDYARCDILYAGGAFHAVEINGQPMVPDSWFGACAESEGLDTGQYLNAIFCAGIVRAAAEGLPVSLPPAMKTILPPKILERLTARQYVREER